MGFHDIQQLLEEGLTLQELGERKNLGILQVCFREDNHRLSVELFLELLENLLQISQVFLAVVRRVDQEKQVVALAQVTVPYAPVALLPGEIPEQ